jgi:hypothetical protein
LLKLLFGATSLWGLLQSRMVRNGPRRSRGEAEETACKYSRQFSCEEDREK